MYEGSCAVEKGIEIYAAKRLRLKRPHIEIYEQLPRITGKLTTLNFHKLKS